jgi:hypothetical protein
MMDLQVIFIVGWKTIELNSSMIYQQKPRWYCYVENLMPCPLTNFGQSSVTLSPHSTTISSRNPALGDVQRPRTCPASSSPRLLPCPTHPWSHASTLWRHQRQRHRAPADAAAAVPAPPPAPAAESAAPPEKLPVALPTSPANKDRGGNRIGGRAGRGWLKHSW